MWIALTLLGCAPATSDVVIGGSTTAPANALGADAAPAFDPQRGPLDWSATAAPGKALTVTIEQGGAVLWSTQGSTDAQGLLTGSWDASDAGPAPGELLLVVSDGKRQATDPTVAVHTGFDTAWLADDGGTLAHRELLYWRGDQVLQDPMAPVSAAALGADFPPVSDDLVWAPTDLAQPVAYRTDSRPVLQLSVPSTPTGLDLAEVELSVEGWTPVGEARLLPGATLSLQRDGPLSDTVGVSDETLALTFEAIDPGGDRHLLGSQQLPVRIYRTLGPQTTGFAVPEAQPWVAAIDPALRAIDGTPAEHNAVVDSLVDWVYNDLGLTYDTTSGASFYSEYIWGNWDEPHFYLSDFLIRRNGDVVNCSDSGNILATHANMLGADLQHIVILANFGLNEIKAVGQPGFTSCPFGPWNCGFSYHAVTTASPAADFIWDTTLALDGDNDPGSAPSTELLVQTITGDEYLNRLVRNGGASYDFPARVTFE